MLVRSNPTQACQCGRTPGDSTPEQWSMKRTLRDSSLTRDPRLPTNAHRRGSVHTQAPPFSRPKSSKWRRLAGSRTATTPITCACSQELHHFEFDSDLTFCAHCKKRTPFETNAKLVHEE